MNVEAGAGPHGWCLHREILCEGEFCKALRAFDDGDFAARMAQYLRVIRRFRFAVPGAVRRENLGKAEPLRGLHAGQGGAVFLPRHHPVLRASDGVHQGQGGDCASMVLKRIQHAFNDS